MAEKRMNGSAVSAKIEHARALGNFNAAVNSKNIAAIIATISVVEDTWKVLRHEVENAMHEDAKR
jgi:hypothetical protein